MSFNPNADEYFSKGHYPTQQEECERHLEEVKDPDHVELLSIASEDFLAVCSLFPKSARAVQDYCLASIENLSRVRERKEHLHHGNYTRHFYRKG